MTEFQAGWEEFLKNAQETEGLKVRLAAAMEGLKWISDNDCGCLEWDCCGVKFVNKADEILALIEIGNEPL